MQFVFCFFIYSPQERSRLITGEKKAVKTNGHRRKIIYVEKMEETSQEKSNKSTLGRNMWNKTKGNATKKN